MSISGMNSGSEPLEDAGEAAAGGSAGWLMEPVGNKRIKRNWKD
jgi:hypothetical protein